MKKQYALIGLLTIVLGSTINVSAAQTTTNFSNNKNKEQISINLSSEEQKLITQEQKSVVNEIKKLDVDDEKFSEQLNKTINEKYNKIDEEVENKAKEEGIDKNSISNVETNLKEKTYKIDDDKEVNFQGSTVSVDVLEEKDKVTNELEDESEGLESALNFIKSNFIKSVEAATKSKTKEVTYKKYVTDSIIKSWKTAVYYISCEFTYNGTKVTARRTGNYVKPQGVVLNALYCTVDKESAVQKPSSKRRIAYVSGTLEGGIQIKGTGLIVDRFWGRAEIECNSKGTISKRFRHS